MKEKHDTPILPIVSKIRRDIDTYYQRYMGPLAGAVAKHAYIRWVRQGNVGPGNLHNYICMLADEIPIPEKRTEFVNTAENLIKLH